MWIVVSLERPMRIRDDVGVFLLGALAAMIIMLGVWIVEPATAAPRQSAAVRLFELPGGVIVYRFYTEEGKTCHLAVGRGVGLVCE